MILYVHIIYTMYLVGNNSQQKRRRSMYKLLIYIIYARTLSSVCVCVRAVWRARVGVVCASVLRGARRVVYIMFTLNLTCFVRGPHN